MHIPSEVRVTITGEDTDAVLMVGQIANENLKRAEIQVHAMEPYNNPEGKADPKDFQVTLDVSPTYQGDGVWRSRENERRFVKLAIDASDGSGQRIEILVSGRADTPVDQTAMLLDKALTAAGLEACYYGGIDRAPRASELMRAAFERAEQDRLSLPNAYDPEQHRIVTREPGRLVLDSILSALGLPASAENDKRARLLWSKLLMWGDAYSPGPAANVAPTDGLAGAR